jgi:hypothetical protein
VDYLRRCGVGITPVHHARLERLLYHGLLLVLLKRLLHHGLLLVLLLLLLLHRLLDHHRLLDEK